jgi:hypothetical protein
MCLPDSQIADYYCKGITMALVSPDEAWAWADAEIAKADAPDFRFIDIALSRSVSDLYTALRAFVDSEAECKVGPWLLARLQRVDMQSTEALVAAVRKARSLCEYCGLSDEIYYEFDELDEVLFLARHNEYGSVDECRADFIRSLERHARIFPM